MIRFTKANHMKKMVGIITVLTAAAVARRLFVKEKRQAHMGLMVVQMVAIPMQLAIAVAP